MVLSDTSASFWYQFQKMILLHAETVAIKKFQNDFSDPKINFWGLIFIPQKADVRLYVVVLSKFYYQASRKNPNWSFTALSARRPRATKMAPNLSCQVHDNCGLSENLSGLMTIFADIGWVINH